MGQGLGSEFGAIVRSLGQSLLPESGSNEFRLESEFGTEFGQSQESGSEFGSEFGLGVRGRVKVWSQGLVRVGSQSLRESDPEFGSESQTVEPEFGVWVI